ncbi:MAG: pyridoxal phosphate-dependent aminotransferase [Dehalococcoidia bacterium]|nr:pyridoxal phosphate-dependent aminotransferase [Dehalococcoidia bacterium]
MRLAARMSRLGTETAFEALARARALEAQGRSIIHLGIGEPDFDTPEHVRDAAKQALDQGHTHYTPSPGVMEVREAIARHQTLRQGYEVAPSSVIVTPGGKPVMFFTILALAEPGDEVIYPNPGFPIYESMIRFAGAAPVAWPLREENDFAADVDELRSLVSPRTKLIIVNSPNNPCGSVIPPGGLRRIAEIANEADAVVLSDEIYKDFYFESEHVSITGFPGMRERSVILDGLSKSYAMTGWRLGYGVFPEPLVEPVSRLMTNSVSCTAAFTQMAAITALEAPQDGVRAMVAEFAERRDIIVDGLNALPGVRCRVPKGAFYAFPNVEGTGLSSQEFERKMLNDAGVSLLSGTAFGELGQGYVRISFANSAANLREALARMERALAR